MGLGGRAHRASGHARVLVSHSNPLAGAKLVVAKGLTVRQTEEMVNELGHTFKEKTLKAPPPLRHDSDIEALAESLGEKLGLRAQVTFNGRNGKLILNYKSLDQLDEILRLLNA